MGARQSKRSVDITTTPKKGEVDGQPLDGRLEKIEDGGDAAAAVKPAQANGDTHAPPEGVQDGDVMVNGSEAVVDEEGYTPAPATKPAADGDQGSASAAEPEVNGTDAKEAPDTEAKEGADAAASPAEDKPKAKKEKGKKDKDKDKKEKEKGKDKEKTKPVARKFSLRNLLRGKQDTAEVPKENVVTEEKVDAVSTTEAPPETVPSQTDSASTEVQSETVEAPETEKSEEPAVSTETPAQPTATPENQSDSKVDKEQPAKGEEAIPPVPSSPPPMEEPKSPEPVVEEAKIAELQSTEESVPAAAPLESDKCTTETAPPVVASPVPAAPASPTPAPSADSPLTMTETAALSVSVTQPEIVKSPVSEANVPSEVPEAQTAEAATILPPEQVPQEPQSPQQEPKPENTPAPEIPAVVDTTPVATDAEPQSAENITIVAVDSTAPAEADSAVLGSDPGAEQAKPAVE